jgi:hypothetical protein
MHVRANCAFGMPDTNACTPSSLYQIYNFQLVRSQDSLSLFVQVEHNIAIFSRTLPLEQSHDSEESSDKLFKNTTGSILPKPLAWYGRIRALE